MRFIAVKSTVLVFVKYHRNCKLLLGEQEIQSVEEDGHLRVPLSPNKNHLKSFSSKSDRIRRKIAGAIKSLTIKTCDTNKTIQEPVSH